MNITKQRLKQIIKEELASLAQSGKTESTLSELGPPVGPSVPDGRADPDGPVKKQPVLASDQAMAAWKVIYNKQEDMLNRLKYSMSVMKKILPHEGRISITAEESMKLAKEVYYDNWSVYEWQKVLFDRLRSMSGGAEFDRIMKSKSKHGLQHTITPEEHDASTRRSAHARGRRAVRHGEKPKKVRK